MDALDKNAQHEKRKKKEGKRREVKEQRKNRLKEKSNQAILAKAGDQVPVPQAGTTVSVKDVQKLKEKQILKKRESGNKELLTDDLMQKLRFTEKINLVKSLTIDIIAYPAFAYRKLRDLIKLCSDANIDVVLKATANLCDIFCDILPDYRIRQYNDDDKDQKKEKVSKDVQELRN